MGDKIWSAEDIQRIIRSTPNKRYLYTTLMKMVARGDIGLITRGRRMYFCSIKTFEELSKTYPTKRASHLLHQLDIPKVKHPRRANPPRDDSMEEEIEEEGKT